MRKILKKILINIISQLCKLMTIYYVINEKYNINFELKFDTFHNFFDSLKDSKKYYSDCCENENINIIEFNNEYIENINILKSEILKYYILIQNNDNNNNVEKYVVINDEIKELYNSLIKFPHSFVECGELVEFKKINNNITNEIIKSSVHINYFSRKKLSVLIKIYAYYNTTPVVQNFSYKLDSNLLNRIGIIQIIPSQHFLSEAIFDANDTNNLNKYLDSLNYELIYEKELNKILITLPDIVFQTLYYN